MKDVVVFSTAVLLTLAGSAGAVVDHLEDIGPDCTPVTARIIDGVTVDISTASGIDMTARTYNTDECLAFWGDGDEPNNAPLNPENVSGTRFISSGGAGTGLGFSEAQPIIFGFDAPVTLFGLTTLDLLENGSTCNPGGASLTLRAYDASGVVVDQHTRVGGQGSGGLDLDWFVSGSQIVRVELTGGSFGDCSGYGIDDLVLVASTPVDDLEDIGPDCTPVTIRIIDGVTVDISTAGGSDMTARTYYDGMCLAFAGHNNGDNAPLNPENVSGVRFISSFSPGVGFPEAQPIIFEFDTPVTSFGLTTLDLLEDGSVCNPGGANLTLRAYDASGVVVKEHTRVGGQGPGGLDLDWFVWSSQIVRVELTGGSFGECNGYGIDDLVLTAFRRVGDLNCDGLVDLADVGPLVLALIDPAGYATSYPSCDRDLADINADGSANGGDIQMFIDILLPQ